jgi:hypothetical protein
MAPSEDGQNWQARFNGVQKAMGHKEAENELLRTRIAELEQGQGAPGASQDPFATSDTFDSPQPGSEPEAELLWSSPDGQNSRVRLPDGTIATYQTDTPRGTNPAREQVQRDDGSLEYAKEQIRKALGGDQSKTSWP